MENRKKYDRLLEKDEIGETVTRSSLSLGRRKKARIDRADLVDLISLRTDLMEIDHSISHISETVRTGLGRINDLLLKLFPPRKGDMRKRELIAHHIATEISTDHILSKSTRSRRKR